MAIKYCVKTKIDKIKSPNKVKHYAIPIRSGEIDLEVISNKLSKMSTLSEVDVYATIIGMVSVLEQYLHEGYSVRIDRLGIFSISASSEGFDNPKDCVPRKVKAKKICFRAETSLKKNLKYVKFKREKE